MRFSVQNQLQCAARGLRTAERPVLFTAPGLTWVLRASGTVPETMLLSKTPQSARLWQTWLPASGRPSPPACISFRGRTAVSTVPVRVGVKQERSPSAGASAHFPSCHWDPTDPSSLGDPMAPARVPGGLSRQQFAPQ